MSVKDVRALHERVEITGAIAGVATCQHCSESRAVLWPCPTIDALDRKTHDQWRAVRPAHHDPKVGEYVRSKYSPQGVVWRVDAVQGRELLLCSLTSSRTEWRPASWMVVVEEVA